MEHKIADNENVIQFPGHEEEPTNSCKNCGGAPIDNFCKECGLAAVVDPVADPRVKKMIADFYAGGEMYIFTDAPQMHSIRTDPNYWGQHLTDDLQRKYGLCSPIVAGRAPRPYNDYTWAFFNDYTLARYAHILTCSWANSLPLTPEMHKKLLNAQYQPSYSKWVRLTNEYNLARYESEDWSDTPTFCGMSTAGRHVRPTRRAIYQITESCAHVLKALHGQYSKNLPLMETIIGKNWPDADDPMPGNDITGERKKI